jgi:hypothetical protein
MLDLVEKVLVPHKNRQIADNALPPTQVMIVILDLHYSHFQKDVLERFQLHNILSVYIPGGCTDELQVLDVTCNRPSRRH